jgi:NAD+ synthase
VWEQRDESDAQRAIAFILPDETLSIAIKPAADAMLSSLLSGRYPIQWHSRQDFIFGNVNARQRMDRFCDAIRHKRSLPVTLYD